MKSNGIKAGIIVWLAILAACSEKPAAESGSSFTKIDSLTETYLTLQDTMLRSWNVMARDENQKIHALHELTHRLMASMQSEKDELISLEQRLEQLERIRFDQKTMGNAHLVEEYDFTSNSLISEIISLAESDAHYAEKPEL